MSTKWHEPQRSTMVCARIDPELVRRIDAIAAERRWSRSTVITVALERFADENAQIVADYEDGAE